MKNVLLMSLVLLCIASNVSAEGYVYPSGPGGGPAQSCPGCPSPRTHPNGDLDDVWPYSDPIVGFHRFLDSVWINDYQQPFRTARAFRATHVPERDRIYMIIGSALAAYDSSTFVDRLTSREKLVAGGNRKDGKDLYLKPDKFFYAEDLGSSWETVIMDGQDRLIDFDWDDRDLLYLAYAQFGWGIVRDTGGSDGRLMQSVTQNLEGGSPYNIFVLKTSSGRYYAYTGGPGAQDMHVFDVTDPDNPVRKTSMRPGWQPTLYAKTTNHFGVAAGGKIRIYTNDGFVAGDEPIETLAVPGGIYAAITSDGTNFFAAGTKGQNLVISEISVSQGVVREESTTHGVFFPQEMEYAGGHLAIFNYEDAVLYKINGDTQAPIELNDFVLKYYKRPPSGYEVPEQGRVKHATPLMVDQKLYLAISAYSVGDVLEIRSDNAISVELVGRPTGKIFYGDKVGFVAKGSSATPKSVDWNFGNTEGEDDNTKPGLTGQTVYHTFTGLDSTSRVTKTVRATTADSEATLRVNLDPPAAAFELTGTDLVFSKANEGASAPIVVGDTFSDASEGDSTGHYLDWALDGVPNPKRPNETVSVGDCGARTLAFSALYGLIPTSGALSAGGAFIRTIAPFAYTVRPFVGVVNGPESSGSSSLKFTSGSRFGTGFSASSVTHQWDLVDEDGNVIFAGASGTPSAWTFSKSEVEPGSRVRLILTAASAPAGACADFVESVAYSVALNPPDPEIEGGCEDGGPPCEFSVSSPSGQTGWTNMTWSVSPSVAVTAPSFTGLTFKPNFQQAGVYEIEFEATNVMGSGSDSHTENVTTAGSACEDMNSITVFIDYKGPVSGCSPIAGNCNTTEKIDFTVLADRGYEFGCAEHTFTWKFPNGTVNGHEVERQLPAGTHTVEVTIDNGSETFTDKQTVKVGNSTPDPDPPSDCGTMKSSNVFISYRESSSGCTDVNGAACNANKDVSFSVNADRFLGYDFECADHTFSWTIDGQTKSGQSVKHKFTSNGSKNVSVRVNNGSKTFTPTASLRITGADDEPEPPGECERLTTSKVFIVYNDSQNTCSQDGGKCPTVLPITFKAVADRLQGYDFECGTHSFDWEFPGNVKKSGLQVDHGFAINGTYTVKLTVKNPQNQVTIDTEVVVGDGDTQTPEAEVSIRKVFLGSGEYEFTPIIQPPDSVSGVVRYTWDFGDGWQINAPNAGPVKHTYQEPCPECNITLSLYNASGALVMPPIIEPLASSSRRRGARH